MKENKKSLAITHPEIAKEWHPTKNGDLKPTDVTFGSRKRVWWQCEKGHEWQAKIANRNSGNGCPYCANRKVLAGYNDLATTHPEIAKEWHPTKNGDLKPTNVTVGSNKKVWWICEKGHEWEASIANKTAGRGCPYCSNKKVLTGYNDLTITHPEVAKEWHPTKNDTLKPTDVTAGSNKKVWWQCNKGHEWEVSIANRTAGRGCPYCSNHKVLAGYNDLTITHPEIAKGWHPTKNGDLKPNDVTVGSGKKVWWKCSKGHEWQASINNRNNGDGCPYCSNHKVLAGYNDLATTHPEIAKEWHPTKNGDLKPTDVTVGSNKKVWWICEKGHEWKTTIGSRTLLSSNCPHCSLSGTSRVELIVLYYLNQYSNCEIIHRYRELGFEIDIYIPSLKIGIEYDGVYFHQNKTKQDLTKNKHCVENGITLYRIREKGLKSLNDTSIDIVYNHNSKKEFSSLISQLILVIFNKKVNIDIEKDAEKLNLLTTTFKKENSLLITHPEIAKEWHPTKNGNLTPEMVTYGSHLKAWWKNTQGREWQSTIYNRTQKMKEVA